MVYEYYMDPQKFADSEAYHDLIGIVPQAQGDLGTLWHINNMLADWPRFVVSVAAHWNTLSAADKATYAATIGSFMRMAIGAEQWEFFINALDIPHAMFLTQYVLPETGEIFQKVYIQKDLNQYLLDSVAGNINLPTEAERADHADAVKILLDRYAPDNWQEKVPAETVNKVLAQIYKSEVAAIQTASMEATRAKNMKLIGLLVVGAFGIFAITKLIPKRKAA
jgi:hypothetical protein